jgi:hypothetical protein
MASEKSYATGVKYGLIAGITYVVLLFVQYKYTAVNPVSFALTKLATFIIIIALFVFAGLARRKELGGYADFRSVLQPLIITIIITEVMYGLFSYIYLNYIDPQFLDNFLNNITAWFEKKGLSQDQIDKQMEMYRNNTTKPTIRDVLFGIATWIVIDAVFGIIIAAVLRRKRPPFENSFNQ